LAAATDIISIPQQLVAKVSGHKEFDLAQLMTSSSLLSTIPPPGISWISPGKDPPLPPKGGFEDSELFGVLFIYLVVIFFIL
jgi:hypothetical protein